MSNQERLHSVKQMNVQWMLLRLAFALPTGVLVYYFLQSQGSSMIMAAFLLSLTSAASVLFMREARFVKALTAHDQAKKVIGIQYQLDYLFVIMMAVIFPMMMRLNILTNLIPFLLFVSGSALIWFTQHKLDQQLSWMDTEQPTRREIQRTRFTW
ncbi:hypothetical protein [Exiguobacterium sp. s55]|uniref:hypothetical protein n=1 Tax=Exiguobacterium sp. s55 TaxID=2751245 RepID=UPI001BEA475E|nr:hypothetical protein [Exiguobacterium sp. s55]